MKRFYCTKCKKVKRTQQWPKVLTDKESTKVTDRIGQCNFHSEKKVRVA